MLHGGFASHRASIASPATVSIVGSKASSRRLDVADAHAIEQRNHGEVHEVGHDCLIANPRAVSNWRPRTCPGDASRLWSTTPRRSRPVDEDPLASSSSAGGSAPAGRRADRCGNAVRGAPSAVTSRCRSVEANQKESVLRRVPCSETSSVRWLVSGLRHRHHRVDVDRLDGSSRSAPRGSHLSGLGQRRISTLTR